MITQDGLDSRQQTLSWWRPAWPPWPASSVCWPWCCSPRTGCARPSVSAGTKQSDVKVRGGTFDLGLYKSLSPPEIFPLKLTQFYICNSIRGVWLVGPGAEESVVLNTLHYHPRLQSSPILSLSLSLSVWLPPGQTAVQCFAIIFILFRYSQSHWHQLTGFLTAKSFIKLIVKNESSWH